MKPKLQLLALSTILLLLPSCDSIGVGKVEIVEVRRPDGTFKPDNEVINADGERPDASGKIYHYPSGKLGVSGWYGGVKGAPQIKRLP